MIFTAFMVVVVWMKIFPIVLSIWFCCCCCCFCLCNSPGCPRTHSADRVGLELTGIVCLCLQNTGIKGIHLNTWFLLAAVWGDLGGLEGSEAWWHSLCFMLPVQSGSPQLVAPTTSVVLSWCDLLGACKDCPCIIQMSISVPRELSAGGLRYCHSYEASPVSVSCKHCSPSPSHWLNKEL